MAKRLMRARASGGSARQSAVLLTAQVSQTFRIVSMASPGYFA